MERPVLVTGATGCIGGRLVEKLVLERAQGVRALVRNWPRAIRLARFPVELRRGDLDNPADVAEAVKGCRAVVHCAHDYERPETNVEAARALLGACAEHGVDRLVYVSSLSVYEPLPAGELDESAPRVPCGWVYPDNKLEVEQLFEVAQRDGGVPVAIIEPTVVYGPYSEPWTMRIAPYLRYGRPVLPDDGSGLCNAVYVDDVVESLIRAVEVDAAVGERVLVSGPETVTWREFFGAYERMLGVSSVMLMPVAEITAAIDRGSSSARTASSARRDPRAFARAVLGERAVERIGAALGERLKRSVSQSVPTPLVWPSPQELALYSAHTAVSIERARALLDYEPAFSFTDGMALTAEFAAWAGL